MATLLERTRKINRVLQRFHNVEYKEIAMVLSNVIYANVYRKKNPPNFQKQYNVI